MKRTCEGFRPPAHDGVAPSRLVADALAARLRAGIDWRARMTQGDVVDADGRPLAPDAPCVAGQVLWYWRRLPPEPRVPFELVLLHRDEHLVVVDKPHFLATLPGGRYLQETVLVRLRRLLGNDDLVALHRLDRETAGVLLFSARPESRDAYHAVLRERRMRKVYEAVAPYRADLALPLTARHRLLDRRGAHHLPVEVTDGEPNADTRIELLRRIDGPDGALAHYRLTPTTGRRHQLRAQLAALGVPIVGDRIYPRLWPEPAAEAPPDYADPLQLLAREVEFVDPLSGLTRRFVSGRRLARA